MARPRKASDDELLDAAVRTVGRVGPVALRLADVAQEAGVVPATLVARFGSKRGLLLAVAARGAGTPPPLDDGPGLRAVERVLDRMADALGDRAEFANHLAFLHIDLTDPEFGALAAQHQRGMRSAIRTGLARARAEGDLPAGTDLGALAHAVHAAHHGALLLWATDPASGPSAKAAARRAVRAVLSAAGAPIRRARPRSGAR